MLVYGHLVYRQQMGFHGVHVAKLTQLRENLVMWLYNGFAGKIRVRARHLKIGMCQAYLLF